MQLLKKVFPKPVLPVNKRFFSFGLSKLVMKLLQIFLIISMFFLGEILTPYFSSFEIGEYFSIQKLLKLFDFISKLFEQLYSRSNNFCFKYFDIQSILDFFSFVNKNFRKRIDFCSSNFYT